MIDGVAVILQLCRDTKAFAGFDSLDTTNIICALTFLFLFKFKLNIVALNQHIAESSVLHIAFVKENFFTLLSRYKTESLHWIEKFHCTLSHMPLLL